MLKKTDSQFFTSYSVIIGFLVIIKIAIHLLLPEYGLHRDEYFYIAIGDQFSFHNLDMPPLTPLYIKLFTALFGYSIKTIHFASALCGAISLLFACLITKELGGKRYAVILTGLFFLFSGFLIFGSIFTYDSLDFLIWVAVIFLLVKILKKENPKLWIPVGILLGFGLLNKMTILFLGLAIFISLWLVPQRTQFKGKWIWVGGVIALIFSIPFIIWQSKHDWYFIDFASNYGGGLSYRASFLEFVWNQLFPNNLINFPIWLTGLVLLLFSSKWKQYWFFGVAYLILFFLFYFLGAKFYFLVPFYTILLSVASVKIEEWINNFGVEKLETKIVKYMLPVIYVILSLPFVPMAVPALPVEKFIKFASVLGPDAGVKYENQRINQLPQHFADRFGWEEMVAEITKVYNNLPVDEREEFGIITENWGEASAVHYYKKKYHLPEPISLHGWYYFETLRKHKFKDRYVSIGFSQDELKSIFEDIKQEGFFTNPYCMPHENNQPIFVCRKPKFNLRQFWIVDHHSDPHFIHILRTKGVTDAISYFHDIREKDPSTLLFSERQMNALGYEYLYKGDMEGAIALFKLNIEVYPASSNVYDSLGEGYMENGEYNLAIENYQKSLELNPDNTNAVEKLKELEKMNQEE
jgi:tetratricopeptide (TPR) repeat protein